MATLDEAELRQNIEHLDQSVPKEGAYVEMAPYGGGHDESQIVANRNGYLRLGIEFLKAAFAEKDSTQKEFPDRIDIDLDYLIKNHSAIYFDLFERTEEIPYPFRKGTTQDKIIPYAILIVLGVCAVSAVIGFVVIMGWLF